MTQQRIRWPAVVDRARQIVESYDGGVTLRQVMYRLVSEGALPHTPSMYRHLSSHLAKARREGRFPDLIDTLREVHVPPAWPDATAFLRETVGWFGLDRTQGQRAVYVAAEKDTLRQKDRPAGLADVQDDYEVWGKSWGEILEAGEKKLRFFQDQLNYEATDDRVTQHLRESYSHFIPDALTQSPEDSGETDQ